MKNFALYRIPHQKDVHFIAGETLTPLREVTISTITGFVIHPFMNNEQAWLIQKNYFKVNPDNAFLNKLSFHFNESEERETSQAEYIATVKNALAAITSQTLKKIVPARTKIINKTVNPITVFNKACELYPNAFVSLVSTEATGTWVGASPEILLHVNKHNILQTVALAGTQKSNGKLPSEAVWSQKEIEEQALVSRYIINCFKQIRLREFEEDGPKTIKAGDLLHLKTTFNIDLNTINFTNLSSVLLDLIHPTSATCGMPKDAALAFIKENELFNRRLYCGYIGPVNLDNETHLYVQLRCCQIFTHNALLYAGAGITEDSNPEKEWQETDQKCQTMATIL